MIEWFNDFETKMKEKVVAYFGCYCNIIYVLFLDILLERLRRTTKNLS
jgi:hypothetical protein